jgi:hypothetical protein
LRAVSMSLRFLSSKSARAAAAILRRPSIAWPLRLALARKASRRLDKAACASPVIKRSASMSRNG